MRSGFGASGGGGVAFPAVDPLRDGATGIGASKAWGDVRSQIKYQDELGTHTQYTRLTSRRWGPSRGNEVAWVGGA